jgi:hypothetical protein
MRRVTTNWLKEISHALGGALLFTAAACPGCQSPDELAAREVGSGQGAAPASDAQSGPVTSDQGTDASPPALEREPSEQPLSPDVAAALVVMDAAQPSAPASDDAGSDDAGSDAGASLAEDAAVAERKLDPGQGPWIPVPREQVRSVCRLDPDALARADKILDTPWLAVRYGRLCHAYKVAGMKPAEGFSAAKILGTVATGAVAYQTRDLVKKGPKTGPFSDMDRVDAWLDDVSYNRDARVAHVLAMVAQNDDLSPGKRRRKYDDLGWTQLDSLGPMLNAAIAQDKARLGASLDPFVKRHVFAPLGMTQSTWSDGVADKAFGWTWVTTPLEMARLGLLIMRRGLWNGQRLLDEEYTYRMTHPAFEDADTGFGYCTWLNSASNWTLGGVPTPDDWTADVGKAPHFPGACAPVSVNRQHPHDLSESPDCNYEAPHSCEQVYDVGVWQSVAGFGKVIQGHPGLDLLLVGWNLTPLDFHAMPSAELLWNAVKPAVIAEDPKYRGDEAGFCAAYGSNRYAPDL